MCLAVPAKVLEISGDEAKVDFGGVTRTVNISLVDVKVGEYVIVHAGFAIEMMNEEQAKESLKIWEALLDDTEAGLS
ncbi:MAG: HypC/HybG/HupF family hydrogenase formation chaperone [Halobacteriota archaeon]|nr:HypC/HybG/HupF family hydrogenase formation chaperone [Halobacteriota archaeon]MDY6930714.1 HypC/HybG/HupF family hydrogenase formation chaperone [Halobacteriota archaeon]